MPFNFRVIEAHAAQTDVRARKNDEFEESKVSWV